MSSKKEEQLIQKLKTYLQGEYMQVGDRLPSERNLAIELGFSRNSVRNAIKMFQAKGILEVRPSSGYYLVSKSKLESLFIDKDEEEEKTWVRDQLEAFFLFEPQAVMLAAGKMSEREMKSLENCLVDLSKSILENNTGAIVNNHKAFHEIIARGTGNRAIYQMMQRLEYTYELIANVIQKISQEEKDQIFALHVNLFKSISNRDTAKSYEMAREMVLSISDLLNRFEGVELPDTINKINHKTV